MNSYIFAIIILIINCLAVAFAQVLLKFAASKQYSKAIFQYLNWKVILSYFIYFGIVFVNSYLLKFLPIMILTPISESLPYVFTLILSCLFFKEKINAKIIVGALLIIGGIIVMVI